MNNVEQNEQPEETCPHCKSKNTVKKGKYTFRRRNTYVIRYFCNDCSRSFQSDYLKVESKLSPPIVYKYKGRDLQKTNWNLYNEIQTNEKPTVLRLLDELLNLLDIPKSNRVGRPSAEIRDIIYSLLLKTYCRLSSRRLISELQLARQLGYVKNIYSFNTVLNYLSDKRITVILQQLIKLSAKPLNSIEQSFSIDSTGFSTSRYASWFDHKYDKESIKRVFVKAHTVIGNLTNVITAVTITDQNGADITQFKSLAEKTAINFQIKDMCADKAYCSRDNYNCISKLGGTAYIDFRSNMKGRAKGEYIWSKMYYLSKENPQEFYSHYHMRSNVECTYNMIKQKFGTELFGKTYDSNANEILCKSVCHNLCCLISAYLEYDIPNNICADALRNAISIET